MATAAQPRAAGVEAVVFDWGGTLTAWHDVDGPAELLALAAAVTGADHPVDVSAERLHRATARVWGRSRDEHRSATVADLSTRPGSSTTRSC